MGWNGTGTFNRLFSWIADAGAGIDISSVRMDGDTNDIVGNGFGNCLTRDGQGSATANLPMNGFRHTGAGPAVAATDYALLGQVAQVTTLAAALNFYPNTFSVPNGQAMTVLYRATRNDGYFGTFVYDSSDVASTFPQSALGFVDNASRRWKRQYSGAINMLWFGAIPDSGSTDNSTAMQAFFTALGGTGLAGYIPGSSAGYYSFATGITHSSYFSIFGDGIASRLHYTGSGIALALGSGADDGPRFSNLKQCYLTGTASAVGGIYAKQAQQGFVLEDFLVDGFSNTGAYALRLSASWDVQIRGGALKNSTNGLICDDTSILGKAVTNNISLFGVDLSGNTTGLSEKNGGQLNVIGCDFSSTGVGIDIANTVLSPDRVQCINILGNYFESATACIKLGQGAYGTGAVVYTKIEGNYMFGSSACLHIYKADSTLVGINTMAGTNTIDAGVTNTAWNSEAVVTDNATAGQTTYGRLTVGALTIAAATTTSVFKTQAKTVANLVAAATAGAGARDFVTDSNTVTFLAAVSGGGANKIPVVSDGTNWLVG